ncbi:MAG: hypothetical protein EBQ72_01395 [Actinobacteria bacterium]|nr:hypothetical protein [Actinomycetota bacterium]
MTKGYRDSIGKFQLGFKQKVKNFCPILAYLLRLLRISAMIEGCHQKIRHKTVGISGLRPEKP